MESTLPVVAFTLKILNFRVGEDAPNKSAIALFIGTLDGFLERGGSSNPKVISQQFSFSKNSTSSRTTLEVTALGNNSLKYSSDSFAACLASSVIPELRGCFNSAVAMFGIYFAQ